MVLKGRTSELKMKKHDHCESDVHKVATKESMADFWILE